MIAAHRSSRERRTAEHGSWPLGDTNPLFFWLVAAVLAVGGLTGCAGKPFSDRLAAPAPAPAPAAPVALPDLEWAPVFRGVDLLRFEDDVPRPVRGVAVRVDLAAPGVSVVATPDNGAAPGETDGWRTSTFLAREGVQVAVNAAPFSPVHLIEGQPQDVAGFHAAGGALVSEGTGKAALLIGDDGRARIGPAPATADGIRCGVSGFGAVLKGGVVGGAGEPLHPRTAAGVSRDGRWLFLLVIDGRQPGTSEGASTRELGERLKRYGAWDGINLDGGGTTTLVVEGEGVVNTPIHGGVPGLERVAGSHLGVRAESL